MKLQHVIFFSWNMLEKCHIGRFCQEFTDQPGTSVKIFYFLSSSRPSNQSNKGQRLCQSLRDNASGVLLALRPQASINYYKTSLVSLGPRKEMGEKSRDLLPSLTVSLAWFLELAYCRSKVWVKFWTSENLIQNPTESSTSLINKSFSELAWCVKISRLGFWKMF